LVQAPNTFIKTDDTDPEVSFLDVVDPHITVVTQELIGDRALEQARSPGPELHCRLVGVGVVRHVVAYNTRDVLVAARTVDRATLAASCWVLVRCHEDLHKGEEEVRAQVPEVADVGKCFIGRQDILDHEQPHDQF